MFEIDEQGIPAEGTIGVVVSGGFDSSILWHIIYGVCLKRGQKCIPFTVPKNDGALTYANRMLDWSNKRYRTDYPDGTYDISRLHPIVVNSVNVDWNINRQYQGEEVAEQLKGGIVEIIEGGYADYVFTGVNEYPPDYETLCSYHIPAPRNLSRNSDYIYEGKPVSEIILQPFADLDKSDLVLMAEELGILEDITELSHSCVELIRGRCGECFWCKEREWGFAAAGHLDTGIN